MADNQPLVTVTQTPHTGGKLLQLDKMDNVRGQTYVCTKDINSRGKLWDMQRIYNVDGWPDATGDPESDTVYRWPDIIAGKDGWCHLSYLRRYTISPDRRGKIQGDSY